MHIYEKNGHKYPSVTTVLHIIGDEGICNWANSLGYRHISYNKELARLADFGTAAAIAMVVSPSMESNMKMF